MAVEFSAKDWINAIYVAYWGRAADPAGQTYWVDQWGELDDEGNPKEAAWFADTFVTASDEAKDQYDFIRKFIDEEEITTADRVQFVTDIYENLFEKDPADDPGDPDIEGDTALDYWVRMLETGESTPGKFIGDIVFSALAGGEADAEMIQAKVEVAQYITQLAIDKGWDEDDDVLVAWLKGDGADIVKNTKPDNVDAQKAEADQDIPTPDTGNTFTLTGTGAELDNARSVNVDPDDQFLTEKDDTIYAGDYLHGARITDPSRDDNDVLYANIRGLVKPDGIRDIETLNLDFKLGGILDANNISGTNLIIANGDATGRARFYNVDDDYYINANLDSRLTVDDDVKLLMDGGQSYTIRGLDDDQTAEEIEITVKSTNDASNETNELTLYDTATEDDITVYGNNSLIINNLAPTGREVVNELEGDAQLIVTLGAANFHTAIDFEDVEADVYRFNVADATAEMTVHNETRVPTVELNKADNNLVLFVGKWDENDQINIVNNVTLGADAGFIQFGTGAAADDEEAFEIINYMVGGNHEVLLQIKDGASLNINGDSNLDLTISGGEAAIIDASELNGRLTMGTAGAVQGELGGIVHGGNGNDRLALGTAVGADLDIFGGAGDDRILIDEDVSGANTRLLVDGGAGDDLIIFTAGNAITDGATVLIRGGEGNDRIFLRGGIESASTLVVNGGDGDDTITFAMSAAVDESFINLMGGAGNDTFILNTNASGNFTGVATATLKIDGGTGTDKIILGRTTSVLDQTFVFESATQLEVVSVEAIELNGKIAEDWRDVSVTFENANHVAGDLIFKGVNNHATNNELSVTVMDNVAGYDLSTWDHSDLDAFTMFANTEERTYKGTKGDDLVYIGNNNDTAEAFASGTAGGAEGIVIHGGGGNDHFIFGLAWADTADEATAAAFTNINDAKDAAAFIADFNADDDKIVLDLGYLNLGSTVSAQKAQMDYKADLLDPLFNIGDNQIRWNLVADTNAQGEDITWLQVRYDAAVATGGTTGAIADTFYAVQLSGVVERADLEDNLLLYYQIV